MGITSYRYTTWKCDIVSCDEELTLYGDAEEAFTESDWAVAHVLGSEVVLCPEHYKEVCEFFGFVKKEEE